MKDRLPVRIIFSDISLESRTWILLVSCFKSADFVDYIGTERDVICILGFRVHILNDYVDSLSDIAFLDIDIP